MAHFISAGGGATSSAGDVAHDAVDSGNPVKIGFKAYDVSSLPSDVAASDRANGISDLKGRQLVYQAMLQAGEDQTNNVQAMARKPLAVNTYAWSHDDSVAYEASTLSKASAGHVRSIEGYNSKASAQFIQLHNASSVPADTAVPEMIMTVPATSNFSIDFGEDGYYCDTGIAVCNSSTGPTKTIGSADVYFTIRYI